MQTLAAVDPSTASGETKELFDITEQRLKRIPNMIRLLANSPAILDLYLRFNAAFEKTSLPRKLVSLITVAVSEINGCDYTLSTAMAIGRKEGLGEEEFAAARRAESSDARTAAALRFAAQIVQKRGHIPAAEIADLRKAGFKDAEIVEIIAAVSLNIFRNYFNLIAGTEVDFPLVKAGNAA
jgi:uncharacterized peroxidase-related enzyme